MNTTQCIFCKIIAKEVSSYRVYEDDICIGFLDIAPITKGHTLIVPKVHYTDLHDFNVSDSRGILYGLQTVSKAINASFNTVGINIVQNNGIGAGQVIFHLHWHIIPRYVDDGLEQWQGKNVPKENELLSIANSIQCNL